MLVYFIILLPIISAFIWNFCSYYIRKKTILEYESYWSKQSLTDIKNYNSGIKEESLNKELVLRFCEDLLNNYIDGCEIAKVKAYADIDQMLLYFHRNHPIYKKYQDYLTQTENSFIFKTSTSTYTFKLDNINTLLRPDNISVSYDLIYNKEFKYFYKRKSWDY